MVPVQVSGLLVPGLELRANALAMFHPPNSGEEPATKISSPGDVASVVLNVTSTQQDGSADGLFIVLEVTDDDCTVPVAVEDTDKVPDLELILTVEVRVELEEMEGAGDFVVVVSGAVSKVGTELETVDGADSVLDAVAVATTPMVVVYVVIVSFNTTDVILTLVRVSMTVSFVPVQSIGTYGAGVNVEG